MDINKIYNQDCLITMAAMPDNFIDLVVTSPPYDGLRVYNGFSFEFEKVAKELYRTLKPGGVVVWVVNDSTKNGSESLTSFRQAIYFKDICGFNVHDTMLYAKNNYVPLTHNRYEQQFEYMFVLSKGKPKTFNPIMIECKLAGQKRSAKSTFRQDGDETKPLHSIQATYGDKKIKGNIFFYNTNAAIKGHPAIFPEPLAADMISSWSNESDLIYDPFMGSGTTAKMAKLLKRNYIGSEMSAEYCRIAEERLKE